MAVRRRAGTPLDRWPDRPTSAATGSNGIATATLGPAANGVATLRFAITVGGSTVPDGTRYPFEVQKP